MPPEQIKRASEAISVPHLPVEVTQKRTQFLGELSDAKDAGKITQEEYDASLRKINDISNKQNEEINDRIKEMKTEKDKILRASAKRRMEGGTESLLMEGLKSALYFPFGIDKDLSKNNASQNFTKGAMDEILAIPEVVMLLLPPNSQLPAFIEGIKNMHWEDVKNTFFHGVTDIGS